MECWVCEGCPSPKPGHVYPLCKDHSKGLITVVPQSAWMWDFGFLCRHGIQYAACSICTSPDEAPPSQVPCPWRYTDHRANYTCPACKNTGWVEVCE